MKKVFLWIGIVLLTPVLIFVILAVLLYLPPVQNRVVQKVVAVASEQTGMAISVDRVSLVFPLDLGVYGFRALQPNDSLPQLTDTVADVRRLVVDVRLRPLFTGKVVVDELELNDTKLNTANFIAAARVRGSLGRLSVASRGIDLSRQIVDLNNARIDDARLSVELSDSVPPDTSTTKTLWKISIDSLTMARTDVAVSLPGDTLRLRVRMERASARHGEFDLGGQLYTLDRLTLTDGAFSMDNRYEPRVKGLDPNHIALTDINIGIDSVSFRSPAIGLTLSRCSLREKSGIEISRLEGRVDMDSVRLRLPSLIVRTPDSDLEAQVDMELNAFDEHNPGKLYARLLGSIGKQDVMLFCGDMPKAFVRRYPDRPIAVRASANGNMRHIDITGVELSLPTAFRLSASGSAANLTDMKKMQADVRLNATTYDLGFVTALLDPATMAAYRLPQGIGLDGTVSARGSLYTADLTAREGKGTVRLKGNFDADAMSYRAKLDVDRLNLHHFMPQDSLYTLTCAVSVEGRGTDFLSKRSHLAAEASVDGLRYGQWNLDRVTAKALLRDGVGHVNLVSRNELMDGTLTVDALLDPKRVEATIGTDLNKLDLYRLRLMDKPFTAGMCAHVDVASDMKQYHAVKGYFNDFTVRTEKKTYRPADLTLDLLTRRDTTWAKATSGTLVLDMAASGGYETLMEQGQRLMAEAMEQMRDKVIDQPRLRELLPTMNLRFTSGENNPFANFLRFKGVGFSDLDIDLDLSPRQGIKGDMHLYSLVVDSTRIDTVRFHVYQDSTNVRFNGLVQNNKKNPQFVFRTLIDGSLLERGAELNARYYDADDRLGVLLGTRAEMCDSGISVHLQPEQPILGYKKFNLNPDNFVLLGRGRRIRADIDLVADDGMGVKVYSEDSDPDMLQDMTVSLNKFDLSEITSVLPYAPRMGGLLNGDFHVMQDKEGRLSAVSDMIVKQMAYENNALGDIASEFAYLQREDSTHFVEGNIIRNGREVGVLSGSYMNKGEGRLDATFTMSRFPLAMVNGFIPDQMFGFEGYAEGSVTVKGALSEPQVDGEVLLDSSYLVSIPYGMKLRFDDDPVRIVGSNLLFENFTLYANNSNPLNISGNVDFSNPSNMTLDMKMRARDYQIIDAKQTRNSVAYGKAFVNFYGTLNGGLDDLKMRGQLDVLGKTDMTYILKDSPLNTDDRLKDLVTFTDFRDTTDVVTVSRPAPSGIDIFMLMNIEQGARIFCALNADRSNYVDLEGGGELRMTYNASDDLKLTGRYTINSGEMKYALPIIPLKTFSIEEGSYIEFTGDVMNPRLNLTATEQVKSLVTSESGTSRSVLFNCGVKVTKTLSDMGLEFTLTAPEDMTMTNELATMSTEDRGKAAVLMLTTGMYMADGTTGNFSMNSALNSFLQSEINNITSSAMRTIDLSVGLDQNADATGNTYTDYSFKFAKRFWNNRVGFVIGGKLSDNSSSATTTEQDQTFIDNVSLEYRLDQTAMRYVRLFYNKEANDLLEGRISEYGAGFVWRKKADRFWQLFNFRGTDSSNRPPVGQQPNTKPAALPAKNDTIKADENKK